MQTKPKKKQGKVASFYLTHDLIEVWESLTNKSAFVNKALEKVEKDG